MIGALVVLVCLCASFAVVPSASATRHTVAPRGLHVEKVTATSVHLDWRRPRGAKAYRLKYSLHRSMRHASFRRFRVSEGRLTGLRPERRYYFKVRVIRTRSGFAPSHYSRKRTFRTRSRVQSTPRPPSQTPPSQDPPSQDPPSQDPPSQDPPSQDPPTQTPPTPPTPPTRTGTMKYGVSGTNGNFAQGYNAQMKSLGAQVGYLYGQDPRGSQFSGVPEDQDLWIQTKATTRAQYDAMLASFPKHRTGNVYLHYFNEPEDQIERGDMTLKQWQDRTDALYAAIDAAHLSYVKKSVEIMYWTLQQTNGGKAAPPRQINNYLRPGVQQVGFSAYAEKKVKDGHEVAQTDPVKMPAALKTWSANTGLTFSVITGWAVATDLMDDPVTLKNRRDWLTTVSPNLQKAGAQHLMWFDVPWSNGDYRIESDPGLMQVWQDLRKQ